MRASARCSRSWRRARSAGSDVACGPAASSAIVIAVTATSNGSVNGSIFSRSITTEVSSTPFGRRCSDTRAETRVGDSVEVAPQAVAVDAWRATEDVDYEVRTDKTLTSHRNQFSHWFARARHDE